MSMFSVLQISEVAMGGKSDARSVFMNISSVSDGGSKMLQTFAVLSSAYVPVTKPSMIVVYSVLEHVIRAPESNMTTDTFPILPGMTFDVLSTPMFNNKIAVASSGKETRTAFWDRPIWEFTVGFDYLPDGDNSKGTNYKTLCGFFMSKSGSFKSFLFKPTNQHTAVDVNLGVSDGVDNEFTLVREYGPYVEPIGQIDLDGLFIWVEGIKTYVSNLGGFNIPHDITRINSVKRGGTVLNHVSEFTSANQYKIDGAGNVTLSPDTTDGSTITVDFKYRAVLDADFNIMMPRTVVFLEAPSSGSVVTGSYEYYFVCRFKDDQAGFNQFYSRLYELDEIVLRSQL